MICATCASPLRLDETHALDVARYTYPRASLVELVQAARAGLLEVPVPLLFRCLNGHTVRQAAAPVRITDQSPYRLRTTSVRACAVCGEPLGQVRSSNQRYHAACAHEAKKQYQAARHKAPLMACQGCQRLIKRRGSKQKWCPSCAREQQQARDRLRRRPPSEHTKTQWPRGQRSVFLPGYTPA